MPVSFLQFRRTVGLFNNLKFLKCNMNQPFLFDITMCQCHITTLRTCSPLVLLLLVLFLPFCFSSATIQNSFSKVSICNWTFVQYKFYDSTHIWLYTCIIDLSGDIEKNPGPRPSSSQKFPICYWNLNSITAHSYVKIFLLKAYLSISEINFY